MSLCLVVNAFADFVPNEANELSVYWSWRKQWWEWHHRTPHLSIDSHWIINWRCDLIAVISFAFYAVVLLFFIWLWSKNWKINSKIHRKQSNHLNLQDVQLNNVLIANKNAMQKVKIKINVLKRFLVTLQSLFCIRYGRLVLSLSFSLSLSLCYCSNGVKINASI